MAIRLKPKVYGPLRLKSDRPGHFTYITEAGNEAHAGAPATSSRAQPSDLVMAALASCIAISLEMVGREMKIDPGTIDIVVEGAKATDLPHRFARFNLTVHLDDLADQQVAARLLDQAKKICTVSNSLNSEVVIRLGRIDRDF